MADPTENQTIPVIKSAEESAEGAVDERSSEQDGRKRLPKRKVALLIAYCGDNYQGLQLNPAGNTIEKALFDALVKIGAIEEFNADCPQKIGWGRTARTDKGVHAIYNIITGKFILHPDETFVARINNELPSDIRVINIRKVSGGFNPKNSCEARTYSYTIPSIVLRMSRRHPNFSSLGIKESSTISNEEMLNWGVSKEILDQLKGLLDLFKGSHLFHNFTKDAEPADPSSRRFIMEFSVSDPFRLQGVEFIRFHIKGQSFMLHQIRKMIAMVVSVVREGLEPEIISMCFEYPKQSLPLVPGVGLVLQENHFDKYEETKGKAHASLRYTPEEMKLVEKFQADVVHPHIFKTSPEKIRKWLYMMDYEYPQNWDKITKSVTEWRVTKVNDPKAVRGVVESGKRKSEARREHKKAHAKRMRREQKGNDDSAKAKTNETISEAKESVTNGDGSAIQENEVQNDVKHDSNASIIDSAVPPIASKE